MLPVKSYCWICALPVWHTSVGICHYCEKQLDLERHRCQRCGLPLDSAFDCESCAKQTTLWDGLIAAGDYQPPLSRLLHRLKFSGQTAHVVMLSRLILLKYLDYRRRYHWQKPDVLLAVPLHPKRLQQRGFNQSDLLVRPLAHWLQCDYLPDVVRRLKVTKAQHTLGLVTRQQNLQHAFELTVDLQGRHITLVDDVVTTGATVKEIVHLLRQQHVASVQIWCLCRTL